MALGSSCGETASETLKKPHRWDAGVQLYSRDGDHHTDEAHYSTAALYIETFLHWDTQVPFVTKNKVSKKNGHSASTIPLVKRWILHQFPTSPINHFCQNIVYFAESKGKSLLVK